MESINTVKKLFTASISFYKSNNFNKVIEIYLHILQATRSNQARLICYRNLHYLIVNHAHNIKLNQVARAHSNKFPLTITTCKRYDLFLRTISSFFSFISDTELVEKIYIIDDGSSLEDLHKMQSTMLNLEIPFTIVEKTEKGHASSMNVARDIVLKHHASSSKFFIHLEDDFEFFIGGPLLSMCANVLEEFVQYGQCLFNNSYRENKSDLSSSPLGKLKKTAGNLPFCEHVWKDAGSPHGYWPGFSLRPGLNRIDTLEQVGEFIEVGSFEKDYAVRCHDAGWRTAYLETTFAEHIGRKTDNRSSGETNAYDLNACSQFGRLAWEDATPSIIPVKECPEIQRIFMSASFEDHELENMAVILGHLRLCVSLLSNFKKIQAYNVGDAVSVEDVVNKLEGDFDPWDVYVDTGADAYIMHYTGAIKILKSIEQNGAPKTNIFDLFAGVEGLHILHAL